ncbi:hypothetical protein LWI28_004055 [Acer negundo]|uniref:C2 domain-containing protein n=1 Tax=Acer negundo TaxID=4023 RepID=A0AAD5NGR3_ACENE|nr:hypothetical protein LWI28_004055 [Acer negundo]
MLMNVVLQMQNVNAVFDAAIKAILRPPKPNKQQKKLRICFLKKLQTSLNNISIPLRPENLILNFRIPRRRYNINGYDLRANKTKTIDSNYDLALSLTVHYADDIESPKSYPSVLVDNRVYYVACSIAPGAGIQFNTNLVKGLPDPSWKQNFRIWLDDPLHNHTFIYMEVIKLYSTSDPGTSNGKVVVGRAKIPMPDKVSRKKEGRFGLMRSDEKGGWRPEGHIAVSMEIVRIDN